MNLIKTAMMVLLVTSAGLVARGQGHETPPQDAAMTGMPGPLEVLKSVKLYPNPATEVVMLRFEAPIAQTVRIQLYSIIGSEMETDAEAIDEFEIHVRVKDLPSGYYLISMQDAGRQRNSVKFLKR